MGAMQTDMEEFSRLLQEGGIRRAYGTVLSYVAGLRLHLRDSLAGSTVSALYQGHLDITHFALCPPLLKQHELKLAVVFHYAEFRFEAWLVGRNKKRQQLYWEQFKDCPWPEYRVSNPGKGVFSILECDLACDVDFDEPEALTSVIEAKTVSFIDNIEGFLSGHEPLRQPDSRE